MPIVKCRYCSKDKRISIGLNLSALDISELQFCCQPSCFKMIHCRGTFADLNQKSILVPSEDLFIDMEMQHHSALNENQNGKYIDRHHTPCASIASSNHSQSTSSHLSSLEEQNMLYRSREVESLRNSSRSREPTEHQTKQLPSFHSKSISASRTLESSKSNVYLPPIQYTTSMSTGNQSNVSSYAQPWAEGEYVHSIDRFRSNRFLDADQRNNVFRVDLSPTFQSSASMTDDEVDFVFRCFESFDSLVVIQGLACRLNPSFWSIPFVLASLPSNVPVRCEHFRWDHSQHCMIFESEHHIPLAHVKSFVLAGSAIRLPTNSNQSMTISPPNDGLSLRDIHLEFSANILHRNLKQDFAWDLFPGGANCWMQYMPAQYRDASRFEPQLHLCGTGHRSDLIYTSHGSTDTAYQVVLGEMELIVFDQLAPDQCLRVQDFLKRMGYNANTRSDLVEKYLHNLKKFGYRASVVRLQAGEFIHIHRGRLHMWRSVVDEKPIDLHPTLMFITWEWIYQGISSRGIEQSIHYSMSLFNSHISNVHFLFNPQNYLIEATRQWIALMNLEQFYDKCIERLRAIRPSLEKLIEDEERIQNEGDDSWFIGESHITPRILNTLDSNLPVSIAHCSICKNELGNTFKQCLGCSVFGIHVPFVLCIHCFRHDKQFQSIENGLRSSFGHTGPLIHSQRYKESSDTDQCICDTPVRCPVCDGCDLCCCFCHTMFQTRYRQQRPDELLQLHQTILSRTNHHPNRF